MAVIINGTSGITNVNGSASTPAETGTDTDTGIYYGTNTVGLATNGTNALFIDSSQNVGIGTSSPSAKLHVFGTEVRVQQNAGYYSLFDTAGTRYGYIQGGSGYLDIVSEAGSANTIRFTTNSSERMRVDPSGNVGIGTSSPATELQLYKNKSGDTTKLNITNPNDTGGVLIQMNAQTTSPYQGVFGVANAGGYMQIGMVSSHPIQFITNNAERMRIDSSGNLLVGGTGVIYYSKTLSQFDGSSKYGYTANDTSGVANVGFVAFAVNGTTTTGAIGTITRNGSSNAVLYNTTSDQRLKENIADADAALGVVGAIKVRKYDWKEGGQHENFGFVAQELAQVVNNVVSKGRTEEDMWSLDYGKLTPLLVKAIQEQQALITALTARIEALETK